MPIEMITGGLNIVNVLQDTWGHLRAGRNKKYKGWILFAVSCFGSEGISTVDFEMLDSKGQELSSSPWFYEQLNDYIGPYYDKEPGVYKFTGFYRKGKFYGTIKKVKISLDN